MVKIVSWAGFPLLSSKKPGVHCKDSSASCQSSPGEDHSQMQVWRRTVQSKTSVTAVGACLFLAGCLSILCSFK